jgi:hypothetical protein
VVRFDVTRLIGQASRWEQEGNGACLDDVMTKTLPYEEAVRRIRAEFLEMPDMQIQRLCGVNRLACQAALESLVQTRFLCVTSDGWSKR